MKAAIIQEFPDTGLLTGEQRDKINTSEVCSPLPSSLAGTVPLP